MRKSPRLAQGNHDQSPNRHPTGAVAPAPLTPHHPKSGAALDQLYLDLETRWRLGLKVNERLSPAHSTTIADKTKSGLKRLYWSSLPTLNDTIKNFESVASNIEQDHRLGVLYGMVKSLPNGASPSTRHGTPVGSRNNPQKGLLSVEPTSQSSGRLRGQESNYDDVETYATAVDPGSPTDIDTDDEFVTLQSQSPSPSCRSTSRRLKASPIVSLRPDRKRTSDSIEDTGKPTKLTKTLKGKQPAGSSSPAPIPTPKLFKKPALPRPIQAAPTSFASINTSFNATSASSQETNATSVNTSFNTTAVSSQETNATSVNTSFTSYDGVAESDQRLRDEEKEAFAAAKKREIERALSQGLSRESNSTYGSVDETEMWERSHQLEQELKQAESSATPTHAGTTPVTGTSSNTVMPGHMSLTASFPPERPSVSYPSLEQMEMQQRSSSEGPLVGPQLPPPQLPPPQQPPSVSPSKITYYIRKIPEKGLFVEPLSGDFSKVPFFLQFICCRLSVINGVSLESLLQRIGDTSVQRTSSAFWDALADQIQKNFVESSAVWSAAAAEKPFEGFTFKGKVSFSGRSSASVFKLEPLPIEGERSCQLQRMYGSDRFLYLTFPSFSENKPERFTQDQMKPIEDHWKIWIMQEHSFLGRKWRVFHIEPIRRNNNIRKDGKNDYADKRVVLFATSGHGVTKPMSVGEMLNGFIPLAKNQEQNFCKVYARLDLGLSRTIPTFTFKPSQIRRIRDKLSDRTPETDDFDDKNLDWSEKCPERQVMNDGCAQISVGVALKIWEIYRSATGSDEPLPSAFQGRIRGAKGMWMVSAEAHTRDPEHKKIWIEISDSQSKFEPTQSDEDDRTYNPHRLTFNYVQHSFVNGSTDLHISFIPILVNRGVKRNVIADFMVNYLDIEQTQLLDMLSDPIKLHNWVTKQGSAIPASGIVTYEAALPLAVPEKVKLLLRSGFAPQNSPFLTNVLKRLIRQRQSVMEQRLRAPLGSATFLLGLADPLDVLEPGQVHINFSSPFIDEFTRQTYRHLDGLEVLIARQPACRPSDIQKVRVVAHPKLGHLRDVIVFPTRGQYPLAGKLQGGDYDGDNFWVCWESILVLPFRNAPAPLNPPDPSKYGIRKDTRKLKEVMNAHDLSNIDGFLSEAFNFRIAPSFLGRATNFHEKVAYKENEIFSKNINALCDVHDLLVDAPKQAYQFTEDDFIRLVRYQLGCGNPGAPAYKEAMKDSAKSKDLGEKDENIKKYKHKRDNILDFLYFDVIRRHNTQTRQLVSAALPKEEEDDPALQLPFTQLRDNNAFQAEFRALRVGFEPIFRDWIGSVGGKSEISQESYNKLLQKCYTTFRSLNPSNPSDPNIAPLVYPYLGPNHPTLWETIRASAFYTMFPKKITLVWHMAGKELARLKASGNPDTYHVVPAIFADLKAKPHKAPKLEDEEEEGDEEFESALEKALA